MDREYGTVALHDEMEEVIGRNNSSAREAFEQVRRLRTHMEARAGQLEPPAARPSTAR